MFFLKLILDIKKIVLELLHWQEFLRKHKRLAQRLHAAFTIIAVAAFFILVVYHRGIYDYLVAIRPSENLIHNTLNQCGRGSMITWISINDKSGQKKTMIFKSAEACEPSCLEEIRNFRNADEIAFCKKQDCVKSAVDVNESLYALERVLDDFTIDYFRNNPEITWEVNNGEIFNPVSGLQIEENVPHIVKQFLSMTKKDVEFLKIYSAVDHFGRLSNIFTFSFYADADRACTAGYADSVLRALVNNSKNLI